MQKGSEASLKALSCAIFSWKSSGLSRQFKRPTMLASGSDRIGALDFQESPTNYAPRQFNHA